MGPEVRCTEFEIGTGRRLVPEHLVLEFIRLGVVVNHEALEVLRALVHDLTKRIKIGKHTGILLIELTTVAHDVFTQNKDVIDVSAQIGWNTHGVLHCDNKHGVDVAPVHEEIANILVANPCLVIQTIIQNQEVARVYRRCTTVRYVFRNLARNEFLALQNIADNEGRILLMDEHRRNNFAVEQVGPFCSRNDGSTGKALVMP